MPDQKPLERSVRIAFWEMMLKRYCVIWMKASCAKDVPVSKDGLCFSVQKIAIETKQKTPFTNNCSGWKWFVYFMSRHPELSIKQSKYISKARGAFSAKNIKKLFGNWRLSYS